MALTAASIDRLKAQLLTSGLSQKDQPLFQVINQLIDAVRSSLFGVEALNNSSSSGGGGSSTIINNTILSGLGFGISDGEDGLDGIPGVQGPRGLVGPSGGQIYLPDIAEELIESLNFLGNFRLPTSGQDVPFDALNFTASGTMTWGVAVGDQLSYRWIVFNGNIMVLIWDLETTSVTAPLSTDLRLKLPSGYLTAVPCVPGTHIFIDNGGTQTIGYLRVGAAGQNHIQIRKNDSSNWSASVNNTITIGMAILEVKL